MASPARETHGACAGGQHQSGSARGGHQGRRGPRRVSLYCLALLLPAVAIFSLLPLLSLAGKVSEGGEVPSADHACTARGGPGSSAGVACSKPDKAAQKKSSDSQELRGDQEEEDPLARLQTLLAWAEKNFGLKGISDNSSAYKFVISGDTSEVLKPDEPQTKSRPSIGVAAGQDLKLGETLVVFPPDMIIRGDRLLAAAEDPANLEHPKLFKEPEDPEEDDLGWNQFVAIAGFILREKAKGAESFWKPYLDVLPEFVPLPQFWKDDFIRALEYEPAMSTILGYREAFRSNWEKINPEAIAFASQSQFDWALSLACSRLFDASRSTEGSYLQLREEEAAAERGKGQRGEGQDEEGQAGGSQEGSSNGEVEGEVAQEQVQGKEIVTSLALVPVADMLNHATSYNMEWMIQQAEPATKSRKERLLKPNDESAVPLPRRTIHMNFGVIQEVKEGQELTTTYGTQNNDHLLLSYGFVLLPNVFDDMLVALGPNQVVNLLARSQNKSLVAAKEAKGHFWLEQFPNAKLWGSLGLTPAQVVVKSNAAVLKAKTETYADWDTYGEPKHEAVDVVEAPEGAPEDDEAQPRYAVWGPGDLDPRLLVSFAAMRHVEMHGKEPNYSALAAAVVPFAWELVVGTCLDYAQHASTDEIFSLQEAAADLKRALGLVAAEFSTTLDEDTAALAELRECQKKGFGKRFSVDSHPAAQEQLEGGKGNGSGEKEELVGVCNEEVGKVQREWEMVLQFRISKKTVLRLAQQRLEERCVQATGAEADRSASADAGSSFFYDPSQDSEILESGVAEDSQPAQVA